MTTAQLASLLLFIREKTNRNDGPWVEAILRITGNERGSPWCAAFVTFVLTIVNGGTSPLPTTASCQTLLDCGRKNGWLTTEPDQGDVFLVLNAEGHAHHTGFVASQPRDGHVDTVEGNTNDDGSREGYGVFARQRSLSPSLVFVRVPQ